MNISQGTRWEGRGGGRGGGGLQHSGGSSPTNFFWELNLTTLKTVKSGIFFVSVYSKQDCSMLNTTKKTNLSKTLCKPLLANPGKLVQSKENE